LIVPLKKDTGIKMKNILFVLLMSFSFVGLSQTKPTEDTNFVCIPTGIAKKILTDLNELDRVKKQIFLFENETNQLELKITKQDSIISDLTKKDQNNKIIISSVEEKFKLVDEDNKDLRKEIKRLNTRNTIVEIVSGAILTVVTLIVIYK